MRKLLIVGSQAPGAIENYYIKYLSKSGFEVLVFDPSRYYKINTITEKIKFRFFPRLLYANANKALLEFTEAVLPRIVWVFKGNEFFPETLQIIKKLSGFLVNYNPDHPFIRTYAGTGGINIKNCVPLYDLHFAYSRDLVEKIRQVYKIESHWLPFGFDLSDLEFNAIEDENEELKVCFIGNPDKTRADIIKAIAFAGIEVDVYGHNWKKFLIQHKNIKIFNQVTGVDFGRVMRKYRVQLNIFRPHNVNSHNMRSFEIPAYGGIQLAPQSDEHELLFTEGKEIFLYKNSQHLIDKIEYLLNLTKEQSDLIRIDSRERVVRSRASYECRAHDAGGILKNMEIVAGISSVNQ